MKMPLRGVVCLALASLCALSAPAAPAKPDPQVPNPTTGAPNAASKVVQQFLDDRAAGKSPDAYTLFTDESRKLLPMSQKDMDQAVKGFDVPQGLGQFTPEFRAVVALFLDFHDCLAYRFRVLGPATDDPNVVLVRAYRIGTPLSDIKIIKIVTAPAAAEGGTAHIDGMQTVMRADPKMAAQGHGSGPAAEQATSQSNLKQIALGILIYAQDHDQRLPDADKWVDEIMPYLKSEAIFRDPSAPAEQKYSYAFNRNLSGVRMSALAAPATTVLLFESTTGVKNATDAGTSVPHPGRHNRGTDYAFADGRVKWLADGDNPSFALSGDGGQAAP